MHCPGRARRFVVASFVFLASNQSLGRSPSPSRPVSRGETSLQLSLPAQLQGGANSTRRESVGELEWRGGRSTWARWLLDDTGHFLPPSALHLHASGALAEGSPTETTSPMHRVTIDAERSPLRLPMNPRNQSISMWGSALTSFLVWSEIAGPAGLHTHLHSGATRSRSPQKARARLSSSLLPFILFLFLHHHHQSPHHPNLTMPALSLASSSSSASASAFAALSTSAASAALAPSPISTKLLLQIILPTGLGVLLALACVLVYCFRRPMYASDVPTSARSKSGLALGHASGGR